MGGIRWSCIGGPLWGESIAHALVSLCGGNPLVMHWWPFVRRIHCSCISVPLWGESAGLALVAVCEGNPPVMVDSLHKGPLMRIFHISVVSLKMLNKQSSCQWCEMPCHSRNITVMKSLVLNWLWNQEVSWDHFLLDITIWKVCYCICCDIRKFCRTNFHWWKWNNMVVISRLSWNK